MNCLDSSISKSLRVLRHFRYVVIDCHRSATSRRLPSHSQTRTQQGIRVLFVILACLALLPINAAARCAGLAGVELSELEIGGFFKVRGEWQAMAYGPDSCPPEDGGPKKRERYTLRVGSWLYDADVVNITSESVSFQPIEGYERKPKGRIVVRKASRKPTHGAVRPNPSLQRTRFARR